MYNVIDPLSPELWAKAECFERGYWKKTKKLRFLFLEGETYLMDTKDQIRSCLNHRGRTKKNMCSTL